MFYIGLFLGFNQFALVLAHHCFDEELGALRAAFGKEEFIVSAELDFVVLDGFAQVVGHGVAGAALAAFCHDVFDVVKLLETVDSDGEDLSA